MSSRVITILVAVAALALFVSACGNPNPQPPGLTPIPSLPPGVTPTLIASVPGQATSTPSTGGGGAGGPSNSALGAIAYQRNCTRCHGVQGEGVDATPLRNSGFIQNSSDQAIAQPITNGISGSEMPAWVQAKGGPLTDAQITSIVDYLHTLQGVPSVPKATPAPPEPTPAPQPTGGPTPQPARPSMPGGAGPAASAKGNASAGMPDFGQFCAPCHGPQGVLGIPNPGSDDGSVPEVNPIDPTLKSADAGTFATNVDLFIEHGSIPEGPSPRLLMPRFGDGKMLTEGQIADIIAYVLSLNGVSE